MSQIKRAYVWEFPVRFTHWINVLSMVILAATGIYIGSPFMHAYSSEQYIMGTVRMIHFTAAYALLMSLIIRVYWAFLGNQHASWRFWFPFTPKRFADLIEALKFYSFISRKPPHAVGHTALAGVTYLGVFLLIAFQIASGFAMYSQGSPGFFMTLLGGWLLVVIDVQSLRLYHHIVMYLLIAFAMVHLYIAWWLDTVEKNGVMGSIFGGFKFVTKE